MCKNSEVTLRDTLAMSMPFEAIPKMGRSEAKLIASKYGLEYDEHDPISQIKFTLEYQAIIRYEYADAMMNTRT